MTTRKKYKRCAVCTAYLRPDGTCEFACDASLKRPALRRTAEVKRQRANDRRNTKMKWS